jgi:hypothetical protein
MVPPILPGYRLEELIMEAEEEPEVACTPVPLRICPPE